MIVVDTSALMAIVMKEAAADPCSDRLAMDDRVLISAGTLAEALIVARRRNRSTEMAELAQALDLEVAAVTEGSALRVASAYERWGKGRHPAGLNFGDCFAYELAIQNACPLLFVGDDFSRTDVSSALSDR